MRIEIKGHPNQELVTVPLFVIRVKYGRVPMAIRTRPYGEKDASLWREGRVPMRIGTRRFFRVLQMIGKQGYRKT